MKIFVVSFAVLFACVSAVPERSDERFVDGIIAGVIEDLSQDIKDKGLDPMNIPEEKYEYRLPVTDLLVLKGDVEDFLMEGLSNIVINSINFSVLATRLNFDISLPQIAANVGSFQGDALFFGYETDAQVAGSLVINNPRIVGEIRINLGIISGISVRSINLDFTLGGIESNLNVVLAGFDFSGVINELLGNTIPTALAEHRRDVNRLLEHYAKEAIENNL